MKRLPLISIVVLSLVAALVSCDQDPVAVEITPTIRGTVSIPAGANVSGSDFFIRITEGDKVVHTGKVSSDGSFKVSGLEEGKSYSILLTTEEPGDVGAKSASKAASSSGYGGWLNDVTASMNEQAGVGSVKVKPLGTIKGIVKKDGANDGYDTTAYIPGTSFLAMTDADGSFSIYNVPQSAKPYTIRFTSSGYMPRMVEGIVLYSDDDTVNPVANVPETVTLVKNAGNLVWTITKTGTSDHSGTTVMLTDGTNSYTGSTSNDGSLLISGMEPGTYNATITSSGFVTRTMDGIVIEVAKNTVLESISLTTNGGNIEGMVSLRDGGDSSGVLVTAMSGDGRYSYTSSTVEGGRFVISNAYPTDYTITVSKAGYGPYVVSGVSVVPGQNTVIGSIELVSGYGSIAGRAHGEGEYIGASMNGVVKSDTTSGPNGSYELLNIEPGVYAVTFSKAGYVPYSVEDVVVNAGETSIANGDELVENIGRLVWTIRRPNTNNHAGTSVSISDGRNSYNGTTAEDGNLLISDIIPGKYNATITAHGFVPQNVEGIVIEVGKTTNQGVLTLVSNGGTVYGVVRLAGGSDNSGIAVSLSNGEFYYLFQTLEDGRFEFNNVFPSTYTLTLSNEGFGNLTKENITVTPEGTTDAGSFELISNFGSIEGRAYSEGENVRALLDGIVKAEIISGANGIYVIPNLESGVYSVSFSKEGFVPYVVDNVAVEAGASSKVDGDMLVENVGSLVWTITKSNTNNHSGTSVTLTGDGRSYSADTDKDGVLTISNIIPGRYKAIITAGGFVPQEVDGIAIEAGKVTNQGSLRLATNGGSVSGNASLKGCDDRLGISVSLSNADYYYLYQTQEDGTFEFNNVFPSTYSLGIYKDGYQGTSMDKVVVTPEGHIDVGSFELVSSYGSITGRSSGEGENVRVLLDGAVKAETTSGQNGVFEFANLIPDIYSVEFSKEGFLPYQATNVEVRAGERSIVNGEPLVENIGYLSWTILKTGASDNSNTTVSLYNGESRTYVGTTNPSGALVMSSIVPDTYTALVSSDGYVSQRFDDIEILVGRTTSLPTAYLSAEGGSISGSVKVKGEDNQSGVLVTAKSNDGGHTYTTGSDIEGRFLISNVYSAVYTVTLSKDGYDTIKKEDVEVSSGQTAMMEGLSLVRSTGAVAGFVSLKGQTSAVGTRVEIKSVSSITTTYSATVDSNGMFEITGVEPGNYYLVATKDGFIPNQPVLVTVEKGKVFSVDSIVLVNERVTVKGSVVLDGSASHEGVTVLLSNKDSNGESPSTTTNERGEYTFSDVAPGTYRVIASKDGFATETTDFFDIEASVDRTVEVITLKVATRSITGKVQLEERSQHSGVLITATNVDKTSLVYSAISNADGNFTLAGMDAGRYDITFSCQGFLFVTEYSVDVVKGSSLSLGTINLELARGRIEGYVKLEGRTDHSGTKVTLLSRKDRADGTTYTDSYGFYSLNVPSGNYPTGLSFSHEDFESGQDVRTITVLTGSTYGVDSVSVLTATAVPVISGTVDVKGTDDNGNVNVSIQGTEYNTTTDKTGTFRFEHVSIGSYTLKLSRENTPDVFVPFEAKASASIDLGSVSMIPNSATLSGKATLKSVDSYKGILVTVTSMDGSVTVSGTTDDAGYYYISNVLSSVDHSVTFSKEGWDSKTISVTGLKTLEDRTLDDVELVDTTVPILKSVVINNGSNTTADKNVVIHVNAEDLGSGCRTVMISDFNTSDSIDYASAVDWTLEGVNGEKTVYVKVIDHAGNESNTLSATVTLTDQKTEVKGVLKGDNLTWTKDRSPYLVTGNLLVEKDDVLKIEPGVDVQFEGDYYLQVRGRLDSRGTESNRISFYGIGAGEANWDGMKFVNDNGSVISYSNISGLKNGISGYCDVDHAEITANGWAVGNSASYNDMYCLSGNIMDSMVNGNISVKNGLVISNRIDGETIYLYSMNVDGNTFEGKSLKTSYCFVYNNNVSTANVTSVQDIQKYVTYNNCELQIGIDTDYSKTMRISALSQIQFNNCTFSKFAANVNGSNFINCGSIAITTHIEKRSEFDLTGNYWDGLNTVELDFKGDGSNMSFINDYYDDFNLTKVLYSNWMGSAVSDSGYQGEGFGKDELTTTIYSIGDTGPAGGLVFYDKGFYSDGWRYLEAAPSDSEEEYIFGYYRPESSNLTVGTACAIGSGKLNTERLVKYMDIDSKAYSDRSGEGMKEYAARKCLDYEYGGYDDWFLPSKDELNLMYENLHRKGLGSFANGYYWSSSEYDAPYAWIQVFTDGVQSVDSLSSERRARPVRAF